VYVIHLMNSLSSIAIEGKTLLNIWSGGASQDNDLLRILGCLAYFRVKDDKLNPQAKKFVFLDVKSNIKLYKLWDPENKKIVLNKHVMFHEISLLKSTIPQ